MTRLRLTGLTLMAGLSIALLWIVGRVQAAPLGRNQIRKNGFEITIYVPIDALGLQGRTLRDRSSGQWVDAADYWEQGAEAAWNEGLENFKFRGCYSLQVDLDITPRGDFEAVPEGRHWVWIEPLGFRSKVFHGAGKNDDSSLPYSESRWGHWGPIQPDTVAHESGHFLGLGDDYTDVRNDDGSFSHAQELPGREGTMMANYRSNPDGRIDQSLVNRLGDLLAEFEDLPPCISGFWDVTQREQEGENETTASAFYVIELRPNEAGEIVGAATGQFELVGTEVEGDCSFTYSTSAEINLEIMATGSGDGPYTIEAVEDQKVEDLQRHFLCDQAVDLTLDWDVGLLIEDVMFENGQWEYQDEEDEIVLIYADPEEMDF